MVVASILLLSLLLLSHDLGYHSLSGLLSAAWIRWVVTALGRTLSLIPSWLVAEPTAKGVSWIPPSLQWRAFFALGGSRFRDRVCHHRDSLWWFPSNDNGHPKELAVALSHPYSEDTHQGNAH